MNQGAVRKLTRAALLSLFVLTTTSGVAGLQVLVASPAIADPVDQVEVDQSSAKGNRVAEEAPAPAPAPEKDPVTGLLGGILGGVL